MNNPADKRSEQATPAAADAALVACRPEDHGRRVKRNAPLSEEAFERAAAIFRAAGDISRLKLLERLSEGEWCVSELAEAAAVGMSTVSQQLRLLRSEHLVKRRRSGKHMYYALSDVHVADLIRTALDHAQEAHDPSHAHDHDNEDA